MEYGDSINSTAYTDEEELKPTTSTKLKQLKQKLFGWTDYEIKFSLFSKSFQFTFNDISTTLFVLVNCAIMVGMRSVDAVLIARISNQMENYQYFLSSVFLPLIFTILFIPIILFKMFVTKTITKEMRQFPMWKFAILGLIGTFANLISVVPSAFISGNINIAVNQALIINNMILSFLFLSTRYNALHYGGVLLVIIGIAVDIFPIFLNTKGGSDKYQWAWALLIYASTLLQALSNVFTEKFLKKANLDVWYMQGVSIFMQFIFGLLTFWTAFIPLPSPYQYITPTQLPEYFGNSFKCVVGINSQKGDHCEYIYILLAVFLFFNLGFNMSMLYVFKYGSSTLAVVSSALRLITSNICFMIPFIAGPLTASSLSAMQIESLIILVAGVVMYSVTKETELQNDPIKKFFSKLFSPVKNFFKDLVEKYCGCLTPIRRLLKSRRNKEEEGSLLLE
ncbi:hypothetical protein ABK040_008244 [Willaertia magna]